MENESGVRRVIRDVIELCELQMQLMSIDGRVATEKAGRALVMAVLAVAILGSAVTTLLVALGWILHDGLEWPVGLSLLTVAVAAMVLAAIFGWVSLSAVKKAASAMNETKDEMAENLRWMKGAILNPSTSPRSQLRAESFDGERTRRSEEQGAHSATSAYTNSRF